MVFVRGHAVLFLCSVSNPNLCTVFSKFEHDNEAEETEFSEHASETRNNQLSFHTSTAVDFKLSSVFC